MPRLASSLANSRIRLTKPGIKPIKLADGGGMYLLVRPDGARYWRLGYRFDGKRKTLALGVYPEVTLAEARKRRSAAKTLLSQGLDPAAEKKSRKTASEPAPAASEHYLAHALAIIGEGVLDWDLRSGLVGRHNAQWARLMGLDEPQPKHNWQETQLCLSHPDREGTLDAIGNCQEGQSSFECEHCVKHATAATSPAARWRPSRVRTRWAASTTATSWALNG